MKLKNLRCSNSMKPSKSILIVFIPIFILLFLILSCEEKRTPLESHKTGTGTLKGFVLSEQSQIPIYYATVQTLKNEKLDTTDQQGYFELEDLKVGEDSVIIYAFGYDTLKTIVYIDTGLQHKNFDLPRKYPNLDCIPVEDTSRVYLYNLSEIEIYPKGLFVRFYPWVSDTSRIKQLIESYDLKLYKNHLSFMDQQYVALLCVPEGARAECFFTPYGKEWFDNFSSDSLVEYSFGVFTYGYNVPSGNIVFRFNQGTTQEQIDSFFNDNGLRFLYTRPYPSGGVIYCTLVTPHAQKNVLDLGYDLRHNPLIEFLSVEVMSGQSSMQCD